MLQLQVTNDPSQEFLIEIEDFTLKFELKFLSMIESWQMTLYRDEVKIISNRKMSLGNFNLFTDNQPYNIAITDNLNTGIDPFKLDDFSSGRVSLFLVERSENIEIKGYDVP
jgi:hypothetical protein